MWVAFVFFGSPAHVYFIEGDDLDECKSILLSSFGKEGKTEGGVSDFYENEYLTPLLGIFNVSDNVFNEPQKDPLFYKKGKTSEEIPRTLRAVDGEFCKICKQFFPMAVANQSDGTMVCYVCRESYWWMLK